MPAVKNMAEIAKKWADVTPQRAPQYAQGVAAPRKDWAQATQAANDSWKAGINEAVAKNKFSGGVTKAGTDSWRRGAMEKGTARYGPGVQAAQPDFEKGFAPYRDTIERTALPPRFARRDPRNIERVRVMATALAATKTGQAK